MARRPTDSFSFTPHTSTQATPLETPTTSTFPTPQTSTFPTPQPSYLPTPQGLSPDEFFTFISQATPEQRSIMQNIFSPSAGPSGTTTAAPSPLETPSRRSSNRRGRRSSGGGGGCCGGSTDAHTPPRDRPPISSCETTPRSVGSYSSSRRYSSSPLPQDDARAYNCVDGVVLMDSVGNAMKGRIRELVHTVFAHDTMIHFPQLNSGKKDRIITQILAEFHPREGSETVRNGWIKDQMKQVLSHRRSDVTQAIKRGEDKPWFLDQEIWDEEVSKHRTNPRRYSQQEQAAARRLESVGSSHLGSGGWDAFHAYFERIVHRPATAAEQRYAFHHNTYALLEQLEREGVHIDWANLGEIPQPQAPPPT